MKYYISKSEIHGNGVFAKKNIKKGEIVFIAKGKLTNWEIKDKKTSEAGPNWLGISHGLWLNPRDTSPLRFINHSCEPTLGIKGRVSFMALRNMKKDEELTFDYSTTEEDLLWSLPHKCMCGSRHCRKNIKSIQSIPMRYFKKNVSAIPVYFQKVYLSYNS